MLIAVLKDPLISLVFFGIVVCVNCYFVGFFREVLSGILICVNFLILVLVILFSIDFGLFCFSDQVWGLKLGDLAVFEEKFLI